jgi:hypothetical protein
MMIRPMESVTYRRIINEDDYNLLAIYIVI